MSGALEAEVWVRDDLRVGINREPFKGRTVSVAYSSPFGGAHLQLTPDDAGALAAALLVATAGEGSSPPEELDGTAETGGRAAVLTGLLAGLLQEHSYEAVLDEIGKQARQEGNIPGQELSSKLDSLTGNFGYFPVLEKFEEGEDLSSAGPMSGGYGTDLEEGDAP